VAISINLLVNHTMETFETHLDSLTSDKQPKDLISLFASSALKEGLDAAKAVGYERIFNEKRKIELELGAYNIIETLLVNLITAAYELYQKDENSLSFRNKRALALMGNDKPEKSDSLYAMYQRVVDYIIGMTDNHAQYVAGQLHGVVE
jgi:dGTPase